MAFEPQSPSPPLASPQAASPVRALLFVNSQGMVFCSPVAFGSGTRLSIGLSTQKIREELDLIPRPPASRVLRLEGAVADCKLAEGADYQRMFQVTLLFDLISETDRQLLDSLTKRSLAVVPGSGGLN